MYICVIYSISISINIFNLTSHLILAYSVLYYAGRRIYLVELDKLFNIQRVYIAYVIIITYAMYTRIRTYKHSFNILFIIDRLSTVMLLLTSSISRHSGGRMHD